MSDHSEFEEYPELKTSILPDFNQLLSQKLQPQNKSGNFDPHALMVKKKEVNSGETQDNTPVQTWPEKDVKALEEFCKQHAVVGFNCGKMSPLAALAFLKNMMGISDGPLSERVPAGYEKFGVKLPTYNQNYPYTQMIKQPTNQKSLLKG